MSERKKIGYEETEGCKGAEECWREACLGGGQRVRQIKDGALCSWEKEGNRGQRMNRLAGVLRPIRADSRFNGLADVQNL